ncbi:hypothetical protein BDY19DRAFT_216431 [Irpex rosettiformis]|uniref:Uncharacterized protein n=1 Tax=Irpex rosettiformis TaxID=378272 RepID=A0ACB8TLU6_9APHY|nr:hypothetical protein BDY19DRAFT_216431 [Irpex rosettiformis]
MSVSHQPSELPSPASGNISLRHARVSLTSSDEAREPKSTWSSQFMPPSFRATRELKASKSFLGTPPSPTSSRKSKRSADRARRQSNAVKASKLSLLARLSSRSTTPTQGMTSSSSLEMSSVDKMSVLPLPSSGELPNVLGPRPMRAPSTPRKSLLSRLSSPSLQIDQLDSPKMTFDLNSERPYGTRPSMLETSQLPKTLSSVNQIVHRFPIPSGQTSSCPSLLTSTGSSPPFTPLRETLPRPIRSENLSSPRDLPSRRSTLPLPDSGPSPSRDTNRAFSSVIPIESESSTPTPLTSHASSQQLETVMPCESSTMTGRSELKPVGETNSFLLISTSGTPSSPPSLLRQEQLLQARLRQRKRSGLRTSAQTTSATDSTRGDALTATTAVTATPAASAAPRTTHSQIAPRPLSSDINERPRRFRGFLWDAVHTGIVTPSASLSETLRPLPYPPSGSALAWETIIKNPVLFSITTPINVDHLEELLRDHPNKPLVDSVLYGFRHGFWPFADEFDAFPDTWDVPNLPLDDSVQRFIAEYAEQEEKLGRYSVPFGPDLLPGMYSMPIHAVPKPNSDKLRLVNNHSATEYSLNDMILKEDVGMRQDNVLDLGANLLHFRSQFPDSPVWLFKSDVTNAYRLLPMHPLWQIKQVVTIGDVRRVDRCCCFGSRGSPDLWCTFMSLVLWIAVHICGIQGLLAYMDDNFAFDSDRNLYPYEPYHASFPSKQVALLHLWDYLNIPHTQSKQLYGDQLTIIGFLVDPVSMIISLPKQSTDLLVSAIRDFVLEASGRRRTLREWQRLLGWINWGLNVVISLLHQFTSTSAPLTTYFGLQTCSNGMRESTFSPVTPGNRMRPICLSSATLLLRGLVSGLCTMAVWASSLIVLQHRLRSKTISFDNLNTVQMFDSFRSRDPYSYILLAAVELLIASRLDLRVWHIPGEQNTIADALSRQLFSVITQYAPFLRISSFTPPRVTSGSLE